MSEINTATSTRGDVTTYLLARLREVSPAYDEVVSDLRGEWEPQARRLKRRVRWCTEVRCQVIHRHCRSTVVVRGDRHRVQFAMNVGKVGVRIEVDIPMWRHDLSLPSVPPLPRVHEPLSSPLGCRGDDLLPLGRDSDAAITPAYLVRREVRDGFRLSVGEIEHDLLKDIPTPSSAHHPQDEAYLLVGNLLSTHNDQPIPHNRTQMRIPRLPHARQLHPHPLPHVKHP